VAAYNRSALRSPSEGIPVHRPDQGCTLGRPHHFQAMGGPSAFGRT
jgi:hypothetical protein